MQTQVSDDGNGYTSGEIYSYSSYLDGFKYIEDVYTCFYSPSVKTQPFMTWVRVNNTGSFAIPT